MAQSAQMVRVTAAFKVVVMLAFLAAPFAPAPAVARASGNEGTEPEASSPVERSARREAAERRLRARGYGQDDDDDAGGTPMGLGSLFSPPTGLIGTAMQAAAGVEGRLVGIGIGLAVDPSISNMGYITVALPPELRQAPGYNPKSGASDWAQVRVNTSGKVVVTMGTAPQGQGHETAVAAVVADELGLTPDDVATVDEFDSHTSVWSVSSGSYSSRFSGIAAGAARRSAGVVRRQILEIGANLLEAAVEDLELADGEVRVKGSPDRKVSLRRVAGVAHWDPHGLPEGMSAGIQASEVFHIPTSAPPTEDDRVNSSHAYGFIADVIAVEVDPVTWQTRILKYASAHDAGTIINPKLVEGQVYGAALHGLGGALLEEYRWDEDGQFLTGSFADYRVLTAAEAPRIAMAHVETPSPFTPVGAKGCGESSSESAPAAVVNAVADALRPLGVKPTHLPLTPARLWELTRS